MYQIIPNRPALQHLLPLVKGVWNHSEKKPASGSAVRRWVAEGSIHVNGERVSPSELLDFPVWSIVVFPNSKHKVTIF